MNLKHLICLVSLILISSCRPKLDGADPIGLVFDKNETQDLVKIHKLSRAKGVRVFFWNVAWGSLNKDHDLDNNLLALTESSARPDLIILAEYKPDALTSQTRQFLTQFFPYQHLIKYHQHSDVGVGIFSSKAFKKGPEVLLDWAPAGYTPEAKLDYIKAWNDAAPNEVRHWNRTYQKLTWRFLGQDYHLVALHLLEPWLAYQIRYGTTNAIQSFLVGGNNPLRHQIHSLRVQLKKDFGDDLNNAPLLMIGDFNAPTAVYGVPSAHFNQLTEDLKSIFPGFPLNDYTFPADSSPPASGYPFDSLKFTIDHALINDKVQEEGKAVLHLKGSDHYALYVVVSSGSSIF